MTEIKDRLQKAAEECLTSYGLWESEKSDADKRENLQESIHELRKVASRLEVEIAISERQTVSNNPIPIPPHRSQTKAKGSVESILPEHTDTTGGNQGGEKKARRMRPKRPNNGGTRHNGE